MLGWRLAKSFSGVSVGIDTDGASGILLSEFPSSHKLLMFAMETGQDLPEGSGYCWFHDSQSWDWHAAETRHADFVAWEGRTVCQPVGHTQRQCRPVYCP